MRTFGLRYSDGCYEIGSTIHSSHIWEDNVQTDEILNGTCAIYVDFDPIYDDEPDWLEIADNFSYPYDHCYILVTEEPCSWGEDPGEIVMKDARIWKQIW